MACRAENPSIWRGNVCFPCGVIAGGGRREVWRQGWLMWMTKRCDQGAFLCHLSRLRLAHQLINIHCAKLMARPPCTTYFSFPFSPIFHIDGILSEQSMNKRRWLKYTIIHKLAAECFLFFPQQCPKYMNIKPNSYFHYRFIYYFIN